MKSESVGFAIFIIVAIIFSIGYSYYRKTYGNKLQVCQNTPLSQTGTQNPEMHDPMYYGAPVTIAVIPSNAEQSYPGNQHFNQSSLSTLGNYSSTNQNNIYSTQALNNSNLQYDNTHDPEHSTAYSDPLPQYAVEDADKLPPYRDSMMHT